MKRSRVLVRLSAGLLLGLGALVLSASSRAEIIERVVAKVNGDIVTQSEFEARQLAAVQAARIPPDQVESYLRQNNQRILQEAVDDLLITQRASELGIKLRPEYVQDVIEGIKKENNIASDEDLRRQLRREGMSVDDLKRNIERSVLRRQVLSRELESKAVVTDADARAEYEKHKDEFGKSASVHLQEIEVADVEQAQDVLRRARGGEDFEAMARALSTAASRASGGDLGQVSPGDMNPALARVVAALPAGGLSEPILTEKGFRIVRVVAKEEATVTPFEQVKDDLSKRLGQERMASAYEAYVEGPPQGFREDDADDGQRGFPAGPEPARFDAERPRARSRAGHAGIGRAGAGAHAQRPRAGGARRRPFRDQHDSAGSSGAGGASGPARARRRSRAVSRAVAVPLAAGLESRRPCRSSSACTRRCAPSLVAASPPTARSRSSSASPAGRAPWAGPCGRSIPVGHAPSPGIAWWGRAGGSRRAQEVVPCSSAAAWPPKASPSDGGASTSGATASWRERSLPPGMLEERPVPAVLRPLHLEKKTGPLRISRGRIGKTLYLSEGRLIFATSTDADDRLGEMLLRKGLISYRVLEESVRAIKAGKRQGTLLVEKGAIKAKDLVDGVTEQVQEIIYSVFLWEEGSFDFQEGDLPSREVIVLRMSTADLIMEGIRRIQSWRRIQRGVGGLEQQYCLAPDTGSTFGDVSLRKEEMDLVAALDGTMSLEEICAAARQPDFQVCRTVWALWAAGLLDRVPEDAQPLGTENTGNTEPHAERMRGASVGHEIAGFNERHRFLFELVSYELREKAPDFFARAFARALREEPALYEGVSVDAAGELDGLALRRNILNGELARYLGGLDRLLGIEAELAQQVLGERKGAIIQEGLAALKEQQLQRAGSG